MLRCASCGEPAIDDEARFCIACGSPMVLVEDPLPGADEAAQRRTDHAETDPDPEPPPPPPRPRPAQGPFIDAPTVAEPPAPPPPPPPPAAVPSLLRDDPPDLPPLVPAWMVVAGVLGLVALLVILLLSG